MAKCGGCGQFIAASASVRCSKCAGCYHRACVGVPPTATPSPAWLCPGCKATLPRTDNSATPVKGAAADYSEPNSLPTVAPPVSTAVSLELAAEIRAFREELSGLRADIRQLRQENAEFRAANEGYNGRMGAVECRLDNIEQRFESTDAASYDRLEQTIADLKLQLNERDQDLLLNDVIVSGIPESKAENPAHIIKTVSLKLGIDLDDRDIVSVERLGRVRRNLTTSPSQNDIAERPRPRAIAVRLSRRGGAPPFCVRDQYWIRQQPSRKQKPRKPQPAAAPPRPQRPPKKPTAMAPAAPMRPAPPSAAPPRAAPVYRAPPDNIAPGRFPSPPKMPADKRKAASDASTEERQAQREAAKITAIQHARRSPGPLLPPWLNKVTRAPPAPPLPLLPPAPPAPPLPPLPLPPPLPPLRARRGARLRHGRQHSRPLRIFWNANGMSLEKTRLLKLLLDQRQADIALINETHLRPVDKLKLSGFHVYREDHVSPSGIAYRGLATAWTRKHNTSEGTRLLDDAELHGYVVLGPEAPTHYPGNRLQLPDVIDLAVMRGITATVNCDVLDDHLLSDHQPVCLTLEDIPQHLRPLPPRHGGTGAPSPRTWRGTRRPTASTRPRTWTASPTRLRRGHTGRTRRGPDGEHRDA
ncbi:hypothetical protein SFRURICE_007104 [Spodoptera frugiperda]|nr:hypothetical protein SFRURICE_007104 [Spodoptera frugiperda]